jgi:hypothetical protein
MRRCAVLVLLLVLGVGCGRGRVTVDGVDCIQDGGTIRACEGGTWPDEPTKGAR